MDKQKIIWIVIMLLLMLVSIPASAVQIVIDKPVRAGELTLFPGVDDQDVYYYVSDKARLATDENGKPKFSFLRYVKSSPSGESETQAETTGGGLVHALVQLGISEEQLQEARRELQRNKPGSRIEGPVVFKSGKFGIISAFKEADGTLSHKVVGVGNAPILDGEKAAISMFLSRQGADILWESFNTPTPDISFSFEMEVDGYLSPHKAIIVADFEQIYEHKSFDMGVAGTFFAAEIKGAFDDLRRSGAIRLEQVGDDEDLEKLIITAYNKISEMMFSPMSTGGTPSIASVAGGAGGSQNALDRATKLLANSRAEARNENERRRKEEERNMTPEAVEATKKKEKEENKSRVPASHADKIKVPKKEPKEAQEAAKEQRDRVTVPSIAVVASFQMKRVRQKGTFKIDLNKYTTDKLTLRFDENVGDLRSYRNDNSMFRQVNLDDPLYRRRDIHVIMDGLNANDFMNYVNSVYVAVKKIHGSGETTSHEIVIKRDNFNTQGNNFSLSYGWREDNDRTKWLDYQYRVVWNFFGNGTIEEPWTDSDKGIINLSPPYHRGVVMIEANPKTLQEESVRAVDIRVYYTLAGTEQTKRITLRPSQTCSQNVDVIFPADQFGYDYEATWMIKNKPSVKLSRNKTSDAILFVDEIPTH